MQLSKKKNPDVQPHNDNYPFAFKDESGNRKQRGENWKLVFIKNSLLIKILHFSLKISNVLKQFTCIYK